MSPNQSTLARWYRSEKDRMVRFVRGLAADAADWESEDVVQEVMLRVWSSEATVEENLGAYIYTALRNRVTDLLRKRRGEVALDGNSNEDEATGSLAAILSDARYDIAGEMEKREMRKLLFAALDSLQPDEREIIMLTEFEGRSFAECANTMRRPIGTLLSRKSRALKKLREHINETLRRTEGMHAGEKYFG